MKRGSKGASGVRGEGGCELEEAIEVGEYVMYGCARARAELIESDGGRLRTWMGGGVVVVVVVVVEDRQGRVVHAFGCVRIGKGDRRRNEKERKDQGRKEAD